MKTAVSIPDIVFKAADQAAKRLGISRSELYTRAVKEMIDFYEGETVTESLDRLYAGESSRLDPSIDEMQSQVVEPEEW